MTLSIPQLNNLITTKFLSMIPKYKYLILLSLFILPFHILAQGKYTKIDDLPIYSEYYQNSHNSFKGVIIFENGSGTPLTEWTSNKTFFQCAKQYGSLFIYDRSGLGKSPPDLSMSTKKPMTAKRINHKLMKLLKKRNIKGPYILVAHSYGGLYAGYFARKHPNRVKGILMVDPVPNDYAWSDDFLQRHNTTQNDIKKMSEMSSKDLYTKYSYINAARLKAMPAQLFFQLMGFEQTKKQVNALSNKIPIIVLSSSFHAPIKGSWYKQQQEWLNHNSNSKIIKVHSGHFIQLEHPKLVCRLIRRLVKLTE